MKLSDYVIDFLKKEGVRHIFEVCGGSITHLLDSVYGRKDIMAISMHHEQAASFAAEGYARINKNLGAAMATSGPGATNLITGIGSAFFDSVPVIFLTGQVNTYEFKFNRPVRQVGFQETDIVNIVKPITKESHLVTDPAKIRYYLERAVYVARSGRPGPVLLDIPMNIQRAEIDPKKLERFKHKSKPCPKFSKKTIGMVISIINKSMRPVVLVGGGVRISKANTELLKFIKTTNIPIVSSLMGLDGFPHDLPSYIGMIGTYGNRPANLAISNADMVLALGTRLDTRQTGTNPHTFARGAKVIHVDIDPHELNNKVKTYLAINCDAREFLAALNMHFDKYDRSRITGWLKKVESYKKKYPSIGSGKNCIDPNYFISKLSEILPERAIICVDVGQHQMWTAQSLKIKKDQRLLTQGGMASMGSSLSMAIGASFARPEDPVVVITGDGGFQVNIQELQTIHHHKLPIKIILLNNNGYGMIRQFQKQYFNSRFQSSAIGYSQPDFQKVVSAYKIPVMKINRRNMLGKKLRSALRNRMPIFLEIPIKESILVTPKLSVNKPLEDQDPPLSLKELKANMLIKLLPKTIKDEKRR